MELLEGEFLAAKEYRKRFGDLYEFLNAIAPPRTQVGDGEWRRKLAEICILVLGSHELQEVRVETEIGIPLGQCSICQIEFDFNEEGGICSNCEEAFCEKCWSREGKCPHCGETL